MNLLQEMKKIRSWVRVSDSMRPMYPENNRVVKLTQEKLWLYDEVPGSKGFVVDSGIGCLDFDSVIRNHEINPEVYKYVPRDLTDYHWEVSRSGRGLHVFLPLPAAPRITKIPLGQGSFLDIFPPGCGQYIHVTNVTS